MIITGCIAQPTVSKHKEQSGLLRYEGLI